MESAGLCGSFCERVEQVGDGREDGEEGKKGKVSRKW